MYPKQTFKQVTKNHGARALAMTQPMIISLDSESEEDEETPNGIKLKMGPT